MGRKFRKRHIGQTVEPQTRKNSFFWQRFFPPLLAVILAGIPFAAGKYIELNSPDPFDSAAYVYSAQHIFSGAKLGIDEIPSAQPGTLLVNMLGIKLFGFSELGPKLVQAALQAIALVLMFYTMRKLYGGLAASIGVIVASLYLSSPLIAKFGNVKEQHMVAFMVIGMCCYMLRQLGGKWWMAILAGAALGWAPMFKQTGISAIVAVGLFVVIQPFSGWRSLKQTAIDIGLLAGGFVLGIAPMWAWLLIENNPGYLPYRWVCNMIYSSGAKGKLGSYVSAAREVFGFKQQFPQVMRYYGCLILPMAMAISALFIWAGRQIKYLKFQISKRKTQQAAPSYEKYVLLFGVWWILDAAFVWISPRGYEQYYLPLNASAAMTGGYIFALYAEKFRNSKNKIGWAITGAVGLIVMLSMGWRIVFGIEVSPFSGQRYGEKSRGYVQRWEEVRQFRLGAKMQWQDAGDYIREHSKADDGIYVWGWFPGIYLRAERFCPSPLAFESMMHTRSPEDMSKLMDDLLAAFNKKRPKFLVDSRKYEFPYNRPPLPLWPTMIKNRGDFQLIQGNDEQVAQFDDAYTKSLAEQFKDGEAERYTAMKPLRNFVMQNYTPVKIYGQFVVFELRNK